MHFEQLTRIAPGQDGAIFGDYLFRFDNQGCATVYDLKQISPAAPDEELTPLCRFELDRTDVVRPHSNASAFGTMRFAPEDEFPLLYTNVYNTYAREADRREGQLCVYRLHREGTQFSSELAQVIQIGFTADPLWCADGHSLRPYGNFAIDSQRGLLYAFVMQEAGQLTRYFVFRLPDVHAGTVDAATGVRRVVLNVQDIQKTFDCPYQHFLQGACIHGGRLYSLEGFANDPEHLPALRIIDLTSCQEIRHICLSDLGLLHEPELIDFHDSVCLYCDRPGHVFEVHV